MSKQAIGWCFVATQVVLLGALILLPGRDDYSLPAAVRTAVDVAFWVGVVLAAIACISLGRALTATPVPTQAGALRTDGLYRFVRHPIYTGVIIIVVSLAVRSRSFASVGIGIATLVFFAVKARWEEARLVEAYPDYPSYAARTPRFFPLPR